MKITQHKEQYQPITIVLETEKEAERIEIGLIETEHDLWISFTR